MKGNLVQITSIALLFHQVKAFAPIKFHVLKSISSCSLESGAGSLKSTEDGKGDVPQNLEKAPTFNGKAVFPIKALTAGLNGHTVPAVYSIMNENYKRGKEGWEFCEHVGFTKDLKSNLLDHISKNGPKTVAYVRALSFAYPQRSAMEEVAGRWKSTAIEAGGNSEFPTRTEEEDEAKRKQLLIELIEATADYDDDDDDDEFEDINGFAREDNLNIIGLDVPSRTPIPIDAQDEDVVSPFLGSDTSRAEDALEGEKLEFNIETVDKILDEIRPYLIQDGGNVSVQSVDVEEKNVYLVLEGACGSCPSSTVTMQMGIQRVLKENFDDLGDVIQVEDQAEEDSKPTELTMEAVLEEVSRISPAITAMGGVVEILSVDPIGVVEVKFRGANKVQQGLELALRDVPFVKHVKFVI